MEKVTDRPSNLTEILSMDPTFYYCANQTPPSLDKLVVWLNPGSPSLTAVGPPLSLESQYKSLFASADINRNKGIKITDNFSKVIPIYGDIERWMDLRQRQNNISSQIGRISRQVNPVERLEEYSGIRWIGRAGLKLANMDAVFNLSRSDDTFRDPVDIRPFSFCDLAGGPGAFTQYLQYRRPRSDGYGMSLETEKKGCAWDLSQIDTLRFNVLKGADGSGDLIKNYYWTIDEIRKNNPVGVDLVVSDGFIKEDATVTFEDYLNEEIANLNLLICELGIGLNILKEGRDMVCKVSDTLRPIMAEVLLVLCAAFENVCLFKPMTSRPANAEKYIICKSRRRDIAGPLRIFSLYYEQISNGYIASPVLINLSEEGTTLFKLPTEFEEKLRRSNNSFIDYQLSELVKIENRIANKRVVIRNLNLPRAYDVWHVPMKGDRYVPPSTLTPCK